MERALLKSTFVRSLLTTILLWTLLPAEAYNGEDFTYEGINYTVINEEQKTCKTKDGYYSSWDHEYRPGNNCYGDIVLPSNPNGYQLKEIGEYGFVECNIKSIR